MKKILVPLVVLCLVFAALPLMAEDAAADHGLQTVDRAWMSAMLANDAAACAALYADDAVLVLPGVGMITGRKAIEEAYAGWLAQVRVTDVAIADQHYESAGDVSTGWGRWKLTSVPKSGGTAMTESGTFCAVALKKDGVWKYAADHAAADPVPQK